MLKKIIPWVVVGIFAAVFVAAFALKDTMNNTISEMMKQQASPDLTTSGEALVDSLYNYTKNGGVYEITFLEFGSTGCAACKRMESVMEEIRNKYPNQVNVVFLNILKPESQLLMKYYGIAVIPTQVLLDKGGKEFFRHSGYIDTGDLEKEFNSFRE
jgi:thioredoxin 1